MRKTAIIFGSVVVVSVAAVLIFAVTFDVNKYRGTIQSELQKRLGRTVTLGEIHLGVFPPRFRVQDLAIADDSQFSPDAPFVKAQEAEFIAGFLWPSGGADSGGWAFLTSTG